MRTSEQNNCTVLCSVMIYDQTIITESCVNKGLLLFLLLYMYTGFNLGMRVTFHAIMSGGEDWKVQGLFDMITHTLTSINLRLRSFGSGSVIQDLSES